LIVTTIVFKRRVLLEPSMMHIKLRAYLD
jgi:hypothetical protein